MMLFLQQIKVFLIKDGLTVALKIKNNGRKLNEIYFNEIYCSDKNNDVFFTTNKGLIYIKENTDNTLKIDGIGSAEVKIFGLYKRKWCYHKHK